MTTFLSLVAGDLVKRYGHDMHTLHVVFPGKRARLFLNDYLVREAKQPVWAPTCHTLQELFTGMSPYTLITPIEAICLLYKAYMAHVPDAGDTLDRFYSWGEVLLSDFDDIDKHLVDAHLLFSNIEDLERLTTDNYLSAEQEKTLQYFFSTFSVEKDTVIRQRFRTMWHAMPSIYDTFNRMMRDTRRLTEGALYRDVLTRIGNNQIQLPEGQFAFVGFNALSEVEKELMRHFKTHRQALFYWDYDMAYYGKPDHEANFFIEDNVKMFGNALAAHSFDTLRDSGKTFTYIATAGSHCQTAHIPQWIKQHAPGQGIPDTAIVLCDETLLESVLHAIPDREHGGPATANITMGYPMTSTAVYSLVRSLLTLHTDGWNKASRRMRNHERRIVERNPLVQQYIADGTLNVDVHEDGSLWLAQYILGVLQFVACRRLEGEPGHSDAAGERDSVTPDHALLCESIYRAHEVLAQVAQLVKDGTLNVDTPCLARVIDQALTRTSIPFHGEPAEGLQVMGMLETRVLDFDNVLMLSVGEGHIPKNDRLPSFIPYSLRKPFHLTTIEHRVGIHAYNFYRLIQRASNVTFVYDTACSDGVKNEMSRFLRQLLVEMRPGGTFPDQAVSLKPHIDIARPHNLQAQKTPQAIEKILAMNTLSPTALEQYIACPLQYYLHYVGCVREYDELDDDMDAATFGEIFHRSAQQIYTGFAGKPLTAGQLQYYIDSKQGERALTGIVEDYFFELYFSQRHLPRQWSTGSLSIRRDVIVGYLKSLLRHDLQHTGSAVCQVMECERPVSLPIVTPSGHSVRIGGTIDRLDLITDSTGQARYRVLDYKTMSRGEQSPSPKTSLDDIFTQRKKYHRHIFQTFLYSLTLSDQTRAIQPAVFYTQDSLVPGYTADIVFNGAPLTDFRPYADEFRNRLALLIDEILNPELPFLPTTNTENCTYCPFTQICRKR